MSDLKGDPQYGDQVVNKNTGEMLVFLGPITSVYYPDPNSFDVKVKGCGDAFHYRNADLVLPLGDRGNVLLILPDGRVQGVTVDYYNDTYEAPKP